MDIKESGQDAIAKRKSVCKICTVKNSCHMRSFTRQAGLMPQMRQRGAKIFPS